MPTPLLGPLVRLRWPAVLGLALVLAGPGTLLRGAPLFSEDFESGRLDPNRWTQQITGGNLIAVQGERAAHGHYALRVSCPGQSEKTWALVGLSHLPDALRDHHFGRAYLFIAPKLPDRHTVLIAAGTPGFPLNTYQEIATAHSRIQLTYMKLTPTGYTEDYHASGAFPLGRWFCLEWEFNDHPDHAAVWIDGQPTYDTGFVSKVTHASDGLIGGFTDFFFGFRLWGPAPEAFEIYYDDIALDTKRIGPIAEKP